VANWVFAQTIDVGGSKYNLAWGGLLAIAVVWPSRLARIPVTSIELEGRFVVYWKRF